jgi:flagellar motor switch protein FliN
MRTTKSFLAVWLAEAPKILSRELSGVIELRPSAHLPQPETAATLAVLLSGYHGSFRITADRYALQALLAGARVTDGTVDSDRDRELWRGILRQAALVAAKSLDVTESTPTVSVEDAAWELGLPSAAYELRFADVVLLVAFTDEIQAPEPVIPEPIIPEPTIPESSILASTSPQAKPETAPQPSASQVVNPPAPPTITPAGIDLLLGVELETSLRFGSREMPLSEVLDLGAGDVVELDRHVSDPVDLLVGDKIVARGEVVLVNGSFGLRVLDVAEPKKCLESIRCLF